LAKAIDKSWHAVCVVPGRMACEAAQRLRGQRFLSRDAPRLPLPDCNHQAECQCKYQHLADRRGDPRRTEDTAVGIAPKAVGNERRRPGERRERRNK
jgi:hypothetical protein